MTKKRCAGFVVVGETVTLVDASIPVDKDEPITIISDTSWTMQSGDRGDALKVLYQRCINYINENKISLVVVKASALPTGAARLALLHSAEARGVILAAAAMHAEVKIISKAVISRTFGERKVDEYLKDDDFWSDHTEGGKLRKTSREAAMFLLAARTSK